MAAVGAVAAAGSGYYAVMQTKKKHELARKASKHGMSAEAYLALDNSMKHKKLAKKAQKHGITPEEYKGKREKEFNEKMTTRYGVFTGALPNALLAMNKKAKKHRKEIKHWYSRNSSRNSSRTSGRRSSSSASEDSD
jgi:hypothetical protein